MTNKEKRNLFPSFLSNNKLIWKKENSLAELREKTLTLPVQMQAMHTSPQ